MTPRQQRRLQQKLARKAEKRTMRTDMPSIPPAPAPSTEPRPCQPELARFSAQGSGAVSEAKLQANRANAQLSVGPVTEIGKQIVSQNATRHGLTGKFQVLADESQSDFDQLLAGFMRAESPADRQEIEFVQQMVEALWLARRATRLQDKCLVAMESGTPDEQRQARKDLGLYLRYQTTHERTYFRFSTELRRRRNERHKIERGFVSQKQREAQENRRKELHDVRQAIQTCRQERVHIQNRIAAAKAERLELQNRTVKSLSAAA